MRPQSSCCCHDATSAAFKDHRLGSIGNRQRFFLNNKLNVCRADDYITTYTTCWKDCLQLFLTCIHHKANVWKPEIQIVSKGDKSMTYKEDVFKFLHHCTK